jgi:hypothetical protein
MVKAELYLRNEQGGKMSSCDFARSLRLIYIMALLLCPHRGYIIHFTQDWFDRIEEYAKT